MEFTKYGKYTLCKLGIKIEFYKTLCETSKKVGYTHRNESYPWLCNRITFEALKKTNPNLPS